EEENQSMTYNVTFYDGSEEVASGNVTDTITWKLDILGVLTVSGTGEMPDYDWEGDNIAPWKKKHSQDIREVVIEAGVTSIGQCAFNDCHNLAKVMLPNDGLTRIGHDAFAGTSKLTSITIPASVMECGTAFSFNQNLEEINVADGNLNYYDIDGVLYYKEARGEGEDPFIMLVNYPGAKNKTFVVPDGVKEIGGNAFAQLGMENVELPEGLEKIGGYAFSNSNLTEIEFPASLRVLDQNVFENSSDLKVAKFYGDKPTMGDDVFANVHETFQIIYRASAEGWSESDGATFIYYGDVSADGVLDEKDANLLNQYFAGWPTVIDHDALDFNDDDMVTRADAMYLARYLAGWSGYGRKH
ncbi:MAG: leucine-rich repeat protein, partial [Clostridia bacterium]|nr:leucine-rich repeat protein [Clostridia bacterium]